MMTNSLQILFLSDSFLLTFRLVASHVSLSLRSLVRIFVDERHQSGSLTLRGQRRGLRSHHGTLGHRHHEL